MPTYWSDMIEPQAERDALRRSEARLRAVLDAAHDFAIVGLDGSGVVTDMSEGAERIFGWREEELLGRFFGEFFTESDRRAGVPQHEMDRARREGRCVDERWHPRRDGSPFWGSGYCYPVEGGGFVKVFQDRTQEMRAESELERKVAERTKELGSAVAELEAFSYSVSHDLRTPLRHIAATSEMLIEDAGPELSTPHREMLARQAHHARRLGTLIDELLRLSRYARAEVRREPLDMTAKARAVAGDAESTCTVEVQDGMAAEGDPDLVRVVLQNLIGNACKFSRGGGRVRVGEQGGVFFVRDEGVGFDMRYVHKVFLPFERLVGESEFPGTGIGLASVKRIVERHGGRVWAESEPGKGSTFWFTLGQEDTSES